MGKVCDMKNSDGKSLHICPECKGKGKFLVCSKMSRKRPTKKNPEGKEFLDVRRVHNVDRQGVMEAFEFKCEVKGCSICRGAGLMTEPSSEKQGELEFAA